jgi:hypothetical protein
MGNKIIPFMKQSFVLLLATLFAYITFAQVNKTDVIANINRNLVYAGDSVLVIADAAFIRKGTKRWLLGDHYRKEWITAVKVPVLHLERFNGGMTAKKEGGGMQTKSLRLMSSANSKQYVIRTIEKFPDQAIPAVFSGTIASSFVKDQISIAHPFAPVIVSELAAAAEIYHTNPRFVFVPYSPNLNQYDSAYGNQFYLLEERPDGNWENTGLFGNSNNIYSTEELRAVLEKNSNHLIDQSSYLRARLLDILIGDWDRHEDQWAWASFQSGDKVVYKPIPKDRDQAFSKVDGVLPWLGTRRWAFRRVQHFGAPIQDIKGLVWSGRNLDRLCLNGLEWLSWQKEVQFMQAALTDDVVETAVRRLPETIFRLSGDEIINKLISRRNKLIEYVNHYYKFLAKEVEWHGTNSSDRFELKPLSDTTLLVKHVAFSGSHEYLIKERIFNSNQTNEIRLYGGDGDDSFRLDTGNIKNVRIRWIGGSGQNEYMDNSNSGQRKKIKVYDTKIETLVTSNKKINVNKHFDTLTHEYSYGRFEYNTFMPVILPGYNPDDGLLLGGGISFKKQKWGHFPFKQHHYLAANYAFRTSAYNFFYEGIFTRAIGRWNVRLKMQLNQPDYVVNFYGLGNNAMLTTKDRSYNRVRVNQFDLDAGIERTFKSRHKVQMRGNFLTTRVESTKGRFVSPGNPVFDSSDFDRTNWVGGTIGYTYESINNVQFPTKGLRLSANVHYLYSHQQSNYFLNNESAISAFIPIGKMVFATRIGGGWLAGEPQFFQYNQLGGLTNLRGFRRSRFSGKSIVYNNNELRLPVANLHGYILRGKLGVSLFSDNGRVWIPNERSDKWHIGYGGSIWVIPYQRMAFTANFGISDEDKIVTVKAGFLF